jgi:hypothetical protein
MGLVKMYFICINLGATLKPRKYVPWMMKIIEFDAFVYNAYVAFRCTLLAHVSKTTLTSVANVMMLFLLTKAVAAMGGEGDGGECRRGGHERNVEGVDLWNFSMVCV